MRVRFNVDAVVMTDQGPLILGNEIAEVTLAPDGRYELTIPKGPLAGSKMEVEGDLFEEVHE